MPVGSTPLTPENSWHEVTVENTADRKGPCLKRIHVAGGWLYMTEVYGHQQATALVFVAADRS